MTKTAQITLNGDTYTIKKFNMGELRTLAAIIANTPADGRPFEIIALALRRAEPTVLDPMLLELDATDIAPAVTAIMELSGMKQTENPPAAAAS